MGRPEIEDIIDLIHLSEDELFSKIGIDVAGEKLRIKPPTKQKLTQKGREWLRANMIIIQNVVCSNYELKSMIKKPTDNQVLATAVLDLIISCAFGVSPITVTALLIKRGITSFCGDSWENDSSTK